MKNKKIILAAILGCSLTFTACSNTSKEKHEKTSAIVDEVQTKEEFNTIIDMAGREVILPRDIQTIGTFGSVGVLNSFVELMESGEKIVNEMPGRFKKSGNWDLQYEFAPQILDGPLFEGENGETIIEEVLSVNPDLCITMSKDKLEELEQSGINVVYLEWSELDDVKVAVELMGDILNKEDIADKYISYFDDMIEKANKLTSDINPKKTVLYGDPISLTQPHLIAEWWITQAGGNSVTDNGRTDNKFTYELEDLLDWNPDIIMSSNIKALSEMENDPKYNNIAAVKDKQVFHVPTVAHVWGNRTVEQPLTVFWAINKMYPEIVSDEDLKDIIKDFYNEFFLYEMSDEQIHKIINGGLND